MSMTIQDNKLGRIGTLCVLYFSQGVPWAFVTIAFVAWLIDPANDFGIDDEGAAALAVMGTLPWAFGKLFLGPMIDRYRFPSMGRRRPWILISQFGMLVTIAAFLLIDNPANNLETIILFFAVHNVFAALQDVSSDAMAVDYLPENEVAFANGVMFVSKGVGFIFASLVLGPILINSGFQAALTVQVAILFAIMMVPLFVLERSTDRRFPWDSGDASSASTPSNEDVMTFGEIWSGLNTALTNSTAKWALLLCLIMWIGGGMGTEMGIIDLQFQFIFIESVGQGNVEEYLKEVKPLILLTTMAGFFVGGFLGSRYGSHRVMTYAIVLGTTMTVLWSLARSNWGNQEFMQTAWIIYTFVWAIVGANLIAMLMSITTGDLGGTQFSIYMTLINIGALLGTALSPVVFDAVSENYPNLFLVGAVFQCLVIVVLLRIDMSTESLGIDSIAAESE